MKAPFQRAFHQTAGELRLDVEAIRSEQIIVDQFQRSALFVGRHRRQRCTAAAGLIAPIDHATNELARKLKGKAQLRQAALEVAGEDVVVLARLQLARLQAVEQLARQLHAAARKFERIATDVALVDLRVHAVKIADDFFVSAVGEQRLTAAGGDLLQLGLSAAPAAPCRRIPPPSSHTAPACSSRIRPAVPCRAPR